MEPDLAGPLIEGGDDGFEVSREGFFAGDFLQAGPLISRMAWAHRLVESASSSTSRPICR